MTVIHATGEASVCQDPGIGDPLPGRLTRPKGPVVSHQGQRGSSLEPIR